MMKAGARVVQRAPLLAAKTRFSGALGAIFFSCREEKIHHRAHRDHREKCFCSRGQGLQGCGSLFVDPSLCLHLFSVTSVVSVVKSFFAPRAEVRH